MRFPTLRPLLFLSLALGGCGGPAASSRPDEAIAAPAAPETWSTWRQARHDSLAGEEGWLTLVALRWLDQPRTTIGSDPGADVVLAHAPPHLGAIVVEGGSARFEPDASTPEGLVTSGTETVRRPLPLVPDDPGPPTILAVGPLRMHVIARAGRLGLRVKDRESEARLAFHGPEVFDYDARFRVPARFEPAAAGESLPIVNVLGQQFDEPLAGRLRFTFEGTEHVLLATWAGASPSEGLSLMIRDATSDEGTSYGAGRYLEVDAPSADGTAIVDFNFAYTPPCGYTDFATCPLPPSDNELPFAILAGERAPEGH